MKNQYFGDINDYRKYGLIRILGDRGFIKTGICWMLTPDDSRTDGKFTNYLDEPKQYGKFDVVLYEFLGECLKRKIRNVNEIANSDQLSNAVFYDPILEDDASQRKQYFSEMFGTFEDVDLIFFDPDNGLETKSIPMGKKDSSKYLYWSEFVECYKAGFSILIYQHFIREKREDFISRIMEEIHIKTGCQNIIYFRTSNVVFFLASQGKHIEYFSKRSKIVSKMWVEQIGVSSKSFP